MQDRRRNGLVVSHLSRFYLLQWYEMRHKAKAVSHFGIIAWNPVKFQTRLSRQNKIANISVGNFILLLLRTLAAA